jgi:hypothetical protein
VLDDVCAGLTSNHWHTEFIPGNASLKMTPDDEMSVEKCISVLLGSKSLELVRFLTSTKDALPGINSVCQ